MAAMLGKATRKNRQGGYWWYCCQGHDGTWKDYIRENRKSQRSREGASWRRDAEESSMSALKVFVVERGDDYGYTDIVALRSTYSGAKSAAVNSRNADYPEMEGVAAEWSTSSTDYTRIEVGTDWWSITSYILDADFVEAS